MIEFQEIGRDAILRCNRLEEEISYQRWFIEGLLETIQSLSDELNKEESDGE